VKSKQKNEKKQNKMLSARPGETVYMRRCDLSTLMHTQFRKQLKLYTFYLVFN